jgi:quinol monooxygenase YgiN
MPVIAAGQGIVTHINVFTTAPEKQQLLVDSLMETVQAARSVKGWLSASIHRSHDGTRVVNYVQYESREAAQAVLKHLAAGGYLKRNTELGTVAPGQYDVVYTLDKA